MVRTHVPDLAIIVLPLLRPLRVLGVVRLLRPAVGIVRATVALHRVLDRPAFRGFLLMVGVVIVSCAAFFLERDRDDEHRERDAQLADLQERLDRIEGLLTAERGRARTEETRSG